MADLNTAMPALATVYASPYILWNKEIEVTSENISLVLVVYFVFVFLIQTLCHTCYQFVPQALKRFDGRYSRHLRRLLIEAPLGRKKHVQPHYVGRFPLSLPTRMETVILVGYVTLNITILVVGYPFHVHDPRYPEKWQQFQMYLGARTGYTALVPLPLLFLFGGRNNLLMWLTGWPFSVFKVFHAWLGRITLINLLVHALCYTCVLASQGKYLMIWGRASWQFALITAATGSMIAVQSMRYMRDRWYELFLFLHIVLVVLFAVGAYHHMNLLVGVEYVRATIAVWALDRILRLWRIEWCGRKFNLTCPASIQLHGAQSRDQLAGDGEFLRIEIEFSGRWSPQVPGRHVFVHFLHQFKSYYQSHPFTLSPCVGPDGNFFDNRFVLLVKVKDGITRSLRDSIYDARMEAEIKELAPGADDLAALEAEASSKPESSRGRPRGALERVKATDLGSKRSSLSSTTTSALRLQPWTSRFAELPHLDMNTNVWVEGPYGTPHRLDAYKEVSFFAGGVGITGVFGYAADLKARGLSRSMRIRLTWVIRTMENLDAYAREIEYLAAPDAFGARVDVRVYVTRDSARQRRLNSLYLKNPEKVDATVTETEVPEYLFFERPRTAKMCREHISDARGDLALMVCGPGGMNDDVRACLVDSIVDCPHRLDYFEESFTW